MSYAQRICRPRALLAGAFLAGGIILLTGCGLGPAPGSSEVTLTVTRGFGTIPVAALSEHRVAGSETVAQMLERHLRVRISERGGLVESIDGVSGGSSRPDWLYYVNGIEGARNTTTTAVHGGDRIWWDLHDLTASNGPPAVVGSFPEPFLHGAGGKRLPTTVACAADAGRACRRVASELTMLGIPVATQLIGTASGTDSLNLVVGTWRDIRPQLVATLLAQGPSASGVYARFTGRNGDQLELLDPDGHVARTLGAGAGLVAATAQASSQPVWLITGTDVAGVSAAAAALRPARLRDHFALAVQGSIGTPVPVQGKLG